jgi:hypothetical protein
MTERIINVIRELAGTRCRCGASKVAKQTFCKACYFRLPAEKRRALYRHASNGYLNAYDDACRLLGFEVQQ